MSGFGSIANDPHRSLIDDEGKLWWFHCMHTFTSDLRELLHFSSPVLTYIMSTMPHVLRARIMYAYKYYV